ncbi:MAG TPA: hypothetical protein DCE55_29240 [Planctomycetaceae bacterium]|nr:hypothetical protein [Planctomycetaceae bacterium]
MRMTKRMEDIVGIAMIIVFGWLIISHFIFAMRHPWATEWERLIYTPSAIALRKVPYYQMRPITPSQVELP